MRINKHNQFLNKKKITNKDIELLAKKISYLNKKTKIRTIIANSIPFCSIKNVNLMNSICSGALYDDGHKRMVVDPRGFFKPHYFIDRKLGSVDNLLGAWNHPFMKKMRNLEYLPKECGKCNFKYKCRGGSRFEAKLHFRKIDSPDPLANFNNIR